MKKSPRRINSWRLCCGLPRSSKPTSKAEVKPASSSRNAQGISVWTLRRVFPKGAVSTRGFLSEQSLRKICDAAEGGIDWSDIASRCRASVPDVPETAPALTRKLDAYLKSQGETRASFAERIGVTPSWISRVFPLNPMKEPRCLGVDAALPFCIGTNGYLSLVDFHTAGMCPSVQDVIRLCGKARIRFGPRHSGVRPMMKDDRQRPIASARLKTTALRRLRRWRSVRSKRKELKNKTPSLWRGLGFNRKQIGHPMNGKSARVVKNADEKSIALSNGKSRLSVDEAKSALRGREIELLRRLRIGWPPQKKASHINCPFPGHKDEHPSWRWDEGKRRWFCSKCGGGDIISARSKGRMASISQARWS